MIVVDYDGYQSDERVRSSVICIYLARRVESAAVEMPSEMPVAHDTLTDLLALFMRAPLLREETRKRMIEDQLLNSAMLSEAIKVKCAFVKCAHLITRDSNETRRVCYILFQTRIEIVAFE